MRLTLVVPCYNEQEAIPIFYDAIMKTAAEMPEARLEDAIRFVRGCMEAQPFPAFDVPILAEAAAGENFGDMAEVDGCA